jgi:hypothetical protein
MSKLLAPSSKRDLSAIRRALFGALLQKTASSTRLRAPDHVNEIPAASSRPPRTAFHGLERIDPATT